MTDTRETPDPADGTSRRTLLRGAAVGGAALWVVPAVQAVTMTPASAQMASPRVTPKPTATATQTSSATTFAGPSHGIVVFDLQDVRYVAKVDKSGALGTVPDQSNSTDAEFLKGVLGPLATWEDGSGRLQRGGQLLPAVNGVVVALYADVPSGATNVRAWTVNGRLVGTPLNPVTSVRGQDYRSAPLVGERVTFTL